MTAQATFNPDLFGRLKVAEQKHFWFGIRRKWILDRLRRFSPPPADLLEIGCGTGNVSSHLARHGYQVIGCEYHAEALVMAWPGFQRVQGSAFMLPFADNTFGIVGLFDVLEHFDDDVKILSEASRVARPGGVIAITVPAREELWSGFDVLSHHKRRYTHGSIRQLIADCGLEVLTIEYMFMSLYLPMKLARGKEAAGSNAFSINSIVNVISRGFFEMERLISGKVPLPTGTSLIGIGKKPGSVV